jgi:hypothetical protein
VEGSSRTPSALLGRPLDPFENMRAEGEHRDDEKGAQRGRDAEYEAPHFGLHAGARTTQQPQWNFITRELGARFAKNTAAVLASGRGVNA